MTTEDALEELLEKIQGAWIIFLECEGLPKTLKPETGTLCKEITALFK